MQLRDLHPGDIFTAASDKSINPHRFTVKGNCMFNRGYGSSTRLCYCIRTQEIVSKSCNLEVIKVGESKHKEKLMQLAGKIVSK